MIQPGFFDLQDRLHKIDKNGDPLAKINETVNWEMFRPALEKARDKNRQSNVGPKGYDVILLFKILILQSLYNLSDDATEFQILDRHSFGRFLGLHISQKVPDATTIWRFREDLVKAGIVEEMFATFDAHLRANGFMAMKGQIVDASIVGVPKQRNSREENARIKEGDIPEDWSENKRRRKDVDAPLDQEERQVFLRIQEPRLGGCEAQTDSKLCSDGCGPARQQCVRAAPCRQHEQGCLGGFGLPLGGTTGAARAGRFSRTHPTQREPQSSIDAQRTGRQQDQIQDPFAGRAYFWRAGAASGEFAAAHDRHSPSPSKDRFAQPGVQH